MVVLTAGERITVPAEMATGMPSASGARLEFSASISITTMPSGLIRGVTPRIRPTLYSKVLKIPRWPLGDMPRDPRDPLADLNVGRLVVERGDLRPAEHVHPLRGLEGPDTRADRIAAGREHQAAEARRSCSCGHAQNRVRAWVPRAAAEASDSALLPLPNCAVVLLKLYPGVSVAAGVVDWVDVMIPAGVDCCVELVDRLQVAGEQAAVKRAASVRPRFAPNSCVLLNCTSAMNTWITTCGAGWASSCSAQRRRSP